MRTPCIQNRSAVIRLSDRDRIYFRPASRAYGTERGAAGNPAQRRFGIPQVSRKKKSRPQAALVDYFSSNEWITTPDRSLGSNHVVFGGMMLPVSAMLISCCIETG